MKSSFEKRGLSKHSMQAVRLDCGNCGRAMQNAHRIHHGVSYCGICYPVNFPPRTCGVCGKVARSHKNNPSPVCRQCLLADRTCLRCGRLTPRAGLRVGDQVACASCAPYYRSPRPCETCGTPSSRLSRARGFPQRGQMCDKCLRKTVAATCSNCHKHRRMYFMTLAREYVCKQCCEFNAPSHACPDCGVTVGGVGSMPCFDCSFKRTNTRKQEAVQHLLVTDAAKQLHADFIRWGNETERVSSLVMNASRYLQYVMRIDAALQRSIYPLGQEVLLQTFSTEELRQMGLLMQFLAEHGFLKIDAGARRQRSDQNLVEEKLQVSARKSWSGDVQRFDVSLQERAKQLHVRTRRVYLHAAMSLLEHAKVRHAVHLTQTSVDELLRKKPGLRASLTPFLSHLTQLHRLNLKAPKKAAKHSASLLPLARTVRDLLDVLSSDLPRPARLALTATLLKNLFNLTLGEVLRLRHEDVDWKCADKIRIRGKWVQLPMNLVPIVRALQFAQHVVGSDAHLWVFPGRVLTDCLSTGSVTYHLRKYLALQS